MTSAQPESELRTLPVYPGAHAMVGYRVDVDEPAGQAFAVLRIEERHANRNGMLHGGIIATLMDAALGYAASIRLGGGVAETPVLTLSLTTQFVGGASIGSVVTARGFAAGGGRKIAYISGEMTDGTGRMIATASGVFKKHPGEVRK